MAAGNWNTMPRPKVGDPWTQVEVNKYITENLLSLRRAEYSQTNVGANVSIAAGATSTVIALTSLLPSAQLLEPYTMIVSLDIYAYQTSGSGNTVFCTIKDQGGSPMTNGGFLTLGVLTSSTQALGGRFTAQKSSNPGAAVNPGFSVDVNPTFGTGNVQVVVRATAYLTGTSV